MKLNLSESIRKLRRDADMTQDDVAAALGVTYQAVSRWENGQSYPDIELLPTIAALFGVDMDKLFGIDEDNETVQIEKYGMEAEKLTTDEERIAHVKRYIEAFPTCVYFKTRLLDLYRSKGTDFTNERLPEMRRLCQFVVDHSNEGVWERTLALQAMICAEDDEELDRWMSLLNRKSDIRSTEALRARYDCRNEVDKYNKLIQEDILESLLRLFCSDFCKRDKQHYKNARSRMEGSKTILRIIDVLSDPSNEKDGWITERIFTNVRLAGGSFGCGEIEEGYAALDRCASLCRVYSEIPKGTELTFNTSVLDIVSVEARGAEAIQDMVIDPLTIESGWEWFNGVRGEDRFKEIVSKVTKIFEEMKSREADE